MNECAYCNCVATTRDHVPPKLLIQKPRPSNLKTVPSCELCNLEASLDEEYFLLFLSSISLHPAMQALHDIDGSVYRSLSRKPSLDDRLITSLAPVYVGGRQHVCIEPEHERLNTVIRKIAHGAWYLRYRKRAARDKFKMIKLLPYQKISLEALQDVSVVDDDWSVQSDTFRVRLARMVKNFDLICVIDFCETLTAFVMCPYPYETVT